MKKIVTAALCAMAIVPGSFLRGFSQDAGSKEKPFGVNFTGYVNCDVFFDSRQTVMSREGQFLFYPEKKSLDANGQDINAKGTFNILSIQSRLTANITGPDILKAQTSGVIEGEFYGNINPNINTFRLRLAYMKLKWKSTELSLGQNWHPMYVPGCMPEVASLNSGAPFLVFSRNPQVRIAQDFGKIRFQLAAISQLDGTSNGPDGPSAKYLRNSLLPELNVLFQFSSKNEKENREFTAGASIDYFMLTPRLCTEVILKPAVDTVINSIVNHQDAVVATYKTDEKSYGLTGNVYAKMMLPKVTLRLGGVYGTDCYAFNMLGGYAVKSIIDTATGAMDYTPVRTASAWIDVKTNGKHWQPGLFAGFSKNLGADAEVAGPLYTRGCDIDYLYRISPRVTVRVSKLRLSTELEYTVAAYGTTDSKARVTNAKEIGNWRLLMGVYYYF
ncbi:MAG TPA: hypothetical protein PKJ28_03235 [Bacteroidales bacterium]|nr:hypothetical protein [Bacteroidales bacterium]